MVTIYSTGCPKCKTKLNQKNVNYNVVDDTDVMVDKGFQSLPMLEVDGELMDFGDAVRWVNEL